MPASLFKNKRDYSSRGHGPLLQTKQPKKANPPKGGFALCVECSVSFRSRK
jgi:hypothetical protein